MAHLTSRWLLAAIVVGGTLLAGDHASAERKRPRNRHEYNADHTTVDLFAAMESGDLNVKLIHKDSTQAKLVIENTTKQPLNVKLPDAFATMPVLAQMGGGFGGGGMSGGGGGQSGGGGFGGGGMGGGMGGGGGYGGGGGGFFNVPAENTGRIEVATVCLEHGKAEPRPSMQYTIKPMSAFSEDPQLRALMQQFAKGEVSQRVAQAAAWHISNKMSWDELAAKKHRHIGWSEPYFTPDELAAARQMSNMAAIAAKDLKPEDTLAEKQDSLGAPLPRNRDR